MPDGTARIGERATFEALRTRGVRRREGSLWVSYLGADPGDLRARVAFAVGRRVGTAVVRNRLRRRLRAVMRALAVDGRLPAGSYLVGATAPATDLRFDELTAAVARIVTAAAGSRGRSAAVRRSPLPARALPGRAP